MPKATFSQKIIRLRKKKNLQQRELAEALNLHLDTIVSWELYDILPHPKTVLKLCSFFNKSPGYFHDYFRVYFNSPEKKLRKWKKKNNLTYRDAAEILGVTYSAFGRLVSGKLKLSYKMYLKMKEAGIL